MTPKSKLLPIVLFLILLFFSSFSFAEELKSEFYNAKVKDISDRAYEPAVIQLLDNAKESIVMSMYMVKPNESGPVYLLVKDLEEALDRGVSVEIYLNTRPDHGLPPSDILAEPLQGLVKKGAKIYKFTSNVRLHDKLIIVDSRYVVDGSMNWSVAAIKSNYESAVLIDSAELAKTKLMRLRNFPLEGGEDKNKPARPKGLESLPEGTIVDISRGLISDKSYFVAMLKAQAKRTMDMYLLLLSESARTGEREFFVSLEDMAISLKCDPSWTDTAIRRQMIEGLKALEHNYKLIDVNFNYAKDAWVELKDLPGEAFKVKGEFFDPKNLNSKSQPAQIVILIKALLEAEGSSIDSISVKELSKRFGISEFSIRKGMKEL